MNRRITLTAVLVTLTIALLLLSGCNVDTTSQKGKDTQPVDESSITDTDLPADIQSIAPSDIGEGEGIPGKGENTDVPDEEQMLSDLMSSGANVFILNNQSESLNIDSLELLLRRTEDDFDEAHVSVVLENERYTVDADYTLYYTYYDVGGWVLDTYVLDSHQSSATMPLLDDTALVNYCNQFFSSTELVDRTYGMDPSGIYQDDISFLATRSSTYLTERFSCYINLAFYDDYWHETCAVEPYDVDFSPLIGTWQFTHYDEYVELTITDITLTDWDHITVTYDYKTSPWYDDGPWCGYFIGSWTSGESREEFGQAYRMPLFRNDGIFDGATYPYITAIHQFLHLAPGGYVDIMAYFPTYIDIDEGIYIDKFMSNYKREGYAGTWNTSTEEKAFFQKIS